MKTVYYKVTGAFGISNIGDIVPAKLITIDGYSGWALLYFPRDKDCCGSFCICKKVGEFWEDIDKKMDTYVNVGSLDRDLRKLLESKK